MERYEHNDILTLQSRISELASVTLYAISEPSLFAVFQASGGDHTCLRWKLEPRWLEVAPREIRMRPGPHRHRVGLKHRNLYGFSSRLESAITHRIHALEQARC